MVLPFIAAGVGIISAISQIKAQSDAARANNQQIAGQIYAEQKNEEVRVATVEFQRKQLIQQAQMETLQRRAAFREQNNALVLSQIQTQAEEAVIRAQADAQIEVNRRNVRDLGINIQADATNTSLNNRKGKADLAKQVAQQPTMGKPSSPIENRRANTDTALAAQGLTGGATTAAIRNASTGQEEADAIIAESLKNEQLGQRELDQYDKYAVADEATRGYQRALTMSSALSAEAAAKKKIGAALNLNSQLGNTNNALVKTKQEQLRLSRGINNTNANTDLKLRSAELTANSNLAASKSAFAQAQAYGQRAPGVNFGAAAASILQQGLPLVAKYTPTAQIRTPTQAEYGMTPATSGLSDEFNARTLNANYSYNGLVNNAVYSRYKPGA